MEDLTKLMTQLLALKIHMYDINTCEGETCFHNTCFTIDRNAGSAYSSFEKKINSTFNNLKVPWSWAY